jgi:hypothetical protein
VIIPNINCTRCALQALSVMTDKNPAGSCCQYPAQQAVTTCNLVYMSCANIVITGTEGGHVHCALG